LEASFRHDRHNERTQPEKYQGSGLLLASGMPIGKLAGGGKKQSIGAKSQDLRSITLPFSNG
jgi:hypothetical protein